ncbi:MAG: helix-turn-helix domain-containing protein [Firmicutes bacterium]|nr:helix-turn-helix domain-containing protein [Bacillota bacterium]MBE3590861.1 helix-turn-helix domain-containing protein [Bacillota bacterium]
MPRTAMETQLALLADRIGELIEHLSKPERKALTLDEAAESIGLSRDITRRLCLAGEIKAFKVGDKWVVPLKAIDEWLERRSEQVAS